MDTTKTSTKLKRKNQNSVSEESTLCKKTKTEKDILAYLSAKDNDVKDKEFLKSMRKCSIPQINEEILQLIMVYFETGELFCK